MIPRFFSFDVTIESNGILETRKMFKMYLISEKIRKRANSMRHLGFLRRTEIEKRGHYLANKGKRKFPTEVDDKMRR